MNLGDMLLGPNNAGFQPLMGFNGKHEGLNYGPYLDPGKFNTISMTGGRHLADRWGGPIMYYPVRRQLTMYTASGGGVGLGPLHDYYIGTNKYTTGMLSAADDALDTTSQANWAPVIAADGATSTTMDL